MTRSLDFVRIYQVLREMSDSPTPAYGGFDAWRWEQYDLLREKRVRNLPLKTCWPKYGDGDFRLELCLGALLVHQVLWSSVRVSLEGIISYLRSQGRSFDLEGILSIPHETLGGLVRLCRFHREKSRRIQMFCQFVSERSGSIGDFFADHDGPTLARLLPGLRIGFGEETRDCVLLYAANHQVFVADTYARTLLSTLGVEDHLEYGKARELFEEGIRRDFNARDLQGIIDEYTPEELVYALCNSLTCPDRSLVLLFQQFHAGIDELGISGRWDEFWNRYSDPVETIQGKF